MSLVTPSLNFNDVPAGETAARAVVFEAIGCHEVHLEITAGPTVVSGPPGTSFGTFSTLGTSVTIPHIASSVPPRGRIWISYAATNAGDVATGTVTVHCTETGQDFVVPIAANAIARPTVAAMLVLDRSGSMAWLAGIDNHTKRMDVLQQAAATFVQLLQRYVGDGVGMVSFDHASYPGVPVTQYAGGPFDLLGVQQAIQALSPQGATSIGAGLTLGRNTLNPVTGYDQKALIVFTDGLENTAPLIADVAGSINDRTFAIGLGTAQQVSAPALNALTNGTGGFLLLSGILSPAIDDTFRLAKYFLQILAGVTNNNIVTDPAGQLGPGATVRIPFQLNETDIDASVILLSDVAGVRFLVETPDGDILDPAAAPGLGATYETGPGLAFYRFTLPLALSGAGSHAGTWHALLDIERSVGRRLTHLSEQTAWSARLAHGVKYCVTVQAWSNLRMEARLVQSGLVPGSTLTVRVSLSEYGIPVTHRANAYAEVERPDGTTVTTALAEADGGVFEADVVASIEGVYRFHVRAMGVTLRGQRFTRERLLTGNVLFGGDRPLPTSPPGQDLDQRLCDLVECLLREGALERWMAKSGIDSEVLRACLRAWCEKGSMLSEEELQAREGTTREISRAPDAPAGIDPRLVDQLVGLVATRIGQPGLKKQRSQSDEKPRSTGGRSRPSK